MNFGFRVLRGGTSCGSCGSSSAESAEEEEGEEGEEGEEVLRPDRVYRVPSLLSLTLMVGKAETAAAAPAAAPPPPPLTRSGRNLILRCRLGPLCGLEAEVEVIFGGGTSEKRVKRARSIGVVSMSVFRGCEWCWLKVG